MSSWLTSGESEDRSGVGMRDEFKGRKKRKQNQNQNQTNPLKQRTTSGQYKLGLYAIGYVAHRYFRPKFQGDII